MVKYKSTRGGAPLVGAAEAIVEGMAPDGGLFVPEEIPKVPLDFIAALANQSYAERAQRILRLFLTDYTEADLTDCLARAYGGEKFSAVEIAPLQQFADCSVLELWHGPTSAFKDMALQLLPHLMVCARKKLGEQGTRLILVATSGDTGKAALEGFKDVENIKIQVFYPQDGVSRIQQLQMVTQTGHNVSVIAVKGNFDDAQSGVKKIFNQPDFTAELASCRVRLSSANSINWGRLVPQIVYYFSAYAELLQSGRIRLGDEVNFAVPTGNFGNILAGFYARSMGLPVHRLVCASNANHVLTDFFRTGAYDCQRTFYKTSTPSMDILISSNLERLLYHLSADPAQVTAWMQALQEKKKYAVGGTLLKKLQEVFWAGWADDEHTKEQIARVYREKKYVLDPHTAVAWKVAKDYQEQTMDERPMVIVSTASPYKFSACVLQALGADDEGLDAFERLDRLAVYAEDEIPEGLASLRSALQLHKDSCPRDGLWQTVRTFAQRE